jgi:hypothetical protein
MNAKKSLLIWICLLTLAWLVSACAGNQPAVAESQGPEQVVEAYYNWFLSDREAGPKDMRNPTFLSHGIIQEIDEAFAQADLGGPIISMVCAQDFPEHVMLGGATVNGDQAVVPLQTSFGSDMEIELQRIDDQWLISGARCIR